MNNSKYIFLLLLIINQTTGMYIPTQSYYQPSCKTLLWAAAGITGVSIATSAYLWYRQNYLEHTVKQHRAEFCKYQEQWQDALTTSKQEKLDLIKQHEQTLGILADVVQKYPSIELITNIQKSIWEHDGILDKLEQYIITFKPMVKKFFEYRDKSMKQIDDLQNEISILKKHINKSNKIPTSSQSQETETYSDIEENSPYYSDSEDDPEDSPNIYLFSQEKLSGALDNLWIFNNSEL